MSPVSLQRVVVRMLYDPAFAEAIFRGDAVPELDADGRRMLTALDPAAYRTDPMRRSRALTALLEEYPASAAMAGIGRLDEFFSSVVFHRAIQGRMSLALAFGGWIEGLAGPVARLERGVALARRATPARPGPRPKISTAPGFQPLDVPGGTLALWQAVRARLGPQPLERLARRPISLDGLPALDGVEHLLIERGGDGQIGVGTCDEALAGLLRYGLTPREPAELEAEAVRLGAEASEAGELIAGLIDEGLLVALPAAA